MTLLENTKQSTKKQTGSHNEEKTIMSADQEKKNEQRKYRTIYRR